MWALLGVVVCAAASAVAAILASASRWVRGLLMGGSGPAGAGPTAGCSGAPGGQEGAGVAPGLSVVW